MPKPKGKVINLGIRKIKRPSKQVVPKVPFLVKASTNQAFVLHYVLTRFSGLKNESKLFRKLCQNTFFKEHAIVQKSPNGSLSLRANKHSKQTLETATPDFLHGVYCNWLVEGIGKKRIHQLRLEHVFGFHEQLKQNINGKVKSADLFSIIQSSSLAQTNLSLKIHKGKRKLFANGSIKPLIEMTPEELIGVHARWVVSEYIKKSGIEEEIKKQVELTKPLVFGGKL